jgi:hypothetical protein
VSVFVFVVVIVMDFSSTLVLRRYLLLGAGGVLREMVAYLHAVLSGGFYVTLLKDSDLFFVEIDYGDNFYRDLVVLNGGSLFMILFHGWSVSVRPR